MIKAPPARGQAAWGGVSGGRISLHQHCCWHQGLLPKHGATNAPSYRPTKKPLSPAAALRVTKPGGAITTIVQEQLAQAAPTLEPRTTFLISHGIGHILVPLLVAWLSVAVIHVVARKARAWCDENPDNLEVGELLGMLPVALECPTVITVIIMATVRVLRNAAWMVDTYVHTFTRKWNKVVDALVEDFCSYLVPIDAVLIKLYSIATVVFLTIAFVKAKTLVLEFFLLRAQQQSLADDSTAAVGPGSSKKATMGSVEDLERLLVPLDALTSWLASLTGGLICIQLLGVNIAPLLAVGGASGIIIGLATQQLLTNAFMGLSLFFTRPFVSGDHVTCQGAGVVLSGVVERVTPMRTYIRTDDDVIVTVPNKTVADMVVFNRSTSLKRSRMALANRKTEPLKLKIKVPHAAAANLDKVQAAVMAVLAKQVITKPPSTISVTASSSTSTKSGVTSMLVSTSNPSSSRSRDGSSPSSSRDGSTSPSTTHRSSSSSASSNSGDVGDHHEVPLVAPGSVVIQLCRLTEAGVELLVKGTLREDISSPATQAMLLELNESVREAGAVLINV